MVTIVLPTKNPWVPHGKFEAEGLTSVVMMLFFQKMLQNFGKVSLPYWNGTAGNFSCSKTQKWAIIHFNCIVSNPFCLLKLKPEGGIQLPDPNPGSAIHWIYFHIVGQVLGAQGPDLAPGPPIWDPWPRAMLAETNQCSPL